VNDDAAALDHLRIGDVQVVGPADVVIDQGVRGRVDDLDPETIRTPSTGLSYAVAWNFIPFTCSWNSV